MEDRFAVDFEEAGEKENGLGPFDGCRVVVVCFGDHDSESYWRVSMFWK